MKIFFIGIIFFFLFTSKNLFSQEKSRTNKSSTLKSQQTELKSLNESINRTREELKDLSKKEHNELNILNKYQRHISSVNRYINLLDQEINSLQDSIDLLKKMIYFAGQNRFDIKKEYTKLAEKALLNIDLTFDDLIYGNGIYSTSIVEAEIIRKITEYSSNEEKKIKNFMDSTHHLILLLNENTTKQKQIINLKEQEKSKLIHIISEKQKLLNKIRSDKNLLEKQLRQKEQSAYALKDLISKMTKKENIATKSVVPEKTQTNPIKFLWPVNSRKILHNYGQYTNPETNILFDNPGIDIATSSGTNVTATASGIVSLVHWLPGFGSLIIIDHGNQYRSVYANLSSVLVSQGTKVTQGQIIAKSGESVDGEILHFELWNGSRRLNPINYLR